MIKRVSRGVQRSAPDKYHRAVERVTNALLDRRWCCRMREGVEKARRRKRDSERRSLVRREAAAGRMNEREGRIRPQTDRERGRIRDAVEREVEEVCGGRRGHDRARK